MVYDWSEVGPTGFYKRYLLPLNGQASEGRQIEKFFPVGAEPRSLFCEVDL